MISEESKKEIKGDSKIKGKSIHVVDDRTGWTTKIGLEQFIELILEKVKGDK